MTFKAEDVRVDWADRSTAGVLYLSGQDVSGLLPSAGEQLGIVTRTLEAMAKGDVQLPPKPAIHPRNDAFIHAMPAYLPESDIAALKWIGGSSGNKALGLPYLSGVIILNDPSTAAPTAIVDAADITAARTAAVTGVCVNRFAPADWRNVVIVGFGVQGRAHARLLEAMNDRVEIDVIGRSASGERVREAMSAADIVITSIPFERPARPFVEASWLESVPLIAPIDFDASLQIDAVSGADTFVVDDIATFEYYRSLDYFEGWPSPHQSLTDALGAAGGAGSTVCCNLGMATLDAAFAHAVVQAARAQGVGTRLR